MKILFVEDTDSWIEEFLPQLQKFGEVCHFKGSNAARRSLDEIEYDLVVCDHNILRFETEKTVAYGTEIYQELRWMDKQIPFIHFSYGPCPEVYGSEKDSNFYVLKKDNGVNLVEFIRKIMKSNKE